MRNQLKLFFIITITANIISLPHNSIYASDINTANKNEVIAAANSGLAKYLAKIPAGKEALYGFNNREEFAAAKIGNPYQVLTLNKNFFNTDKLKGVDYLTSTGEWRVPVTVNGENRILLTVAKMKGVWKAVGIGASGLAKELEKYEKEYPSSGRNEAMILRVSQLDSDFFLVNLKEYYGQLAVVPLFNAKSFFDSTNPSGKTTYTLPDALDVIKNKINNK